MTNRPIDQPWFVGWHWCAYVENKGRGWGIKDPYDNFVARVAAYNRSVYDRIRNSS